MARLNRRTFLLASGVTAGVALAGGATALRWNDLVAAADDRPLAKDASVLVLVTLYGGNDGLNTVVPAADPVYQSNRPGLAYAPHEVLDLGHGLGLNPSMKGFKSLWDAKKLAVVRGVSYPKPDHSHFRSMAIWQTADPVSPATAGWLGRWLDVVGHDPLRAIAVEPVLPPLLAGDKGAGSTVSPTGRDAVPKGPVGRDLISLSHPDPADGPLQAAVATSIRSMVTVDDRLAGLPASSTQARGQQLAEKLSMVARCVAAGVPTQVYSVSLGGFDTHADEKTTQSRLLGQLDSAVSAFLNTAGKTATGRRVVVAIYSEFGRRVLANANDGTDHGTAGDVLIAGDPVLGGFYGDQPDLAHLDDGDLAVTTDFRDVYATLLHKVLATDPEKVLGAGRTTFDLL
jgi:uncharacterized protein (DUF1501 family)